MRKAGIKSRPFSLCGLVGKAYHSGLHTVRQELSGGLLLGIDGVLMGGAGQVQRIAQRPVDAAKVQVTT